MNSISSITRNSALRNRVFQRDKGMCALCACDTEWTQCVYRHAFSHLKGLMGWRALSLWRNLVLCSKFDPRRGSWWESDHIHPLCEGGIDALENLRTLCLPCHKSETHRLRRRRAKTERLRTKQPQRKYQNYQLSQLGN